MANKSIRTRQYIMDKFLEMMREKGFEKITVTGLCKKAEINRGTFYIYFDDKYQLLEEVYKEIAEGLRKILFEAHNEAEKKFPHKEIDNIFLHVQIVGKKTMEYCYKHKETFYDILADSNDNKLVTMFEEVYMDFMKHMLNEIDISESVAYHAIYISGGIMHIVKSWIVGGTKESPSQIAEVIAECISVHKEWFIKHWKG